MKALVVDDDRVLADVVAFTLRREGLEVIQAHDGETALQRWAEEKPDLIVLDVNLPKLDGFVVCRRVREQADTPILLLTVRDEEDDIVRGLELGADDYITKPFSPRQLVARVHAVLRRAGKRPAPAIRQVDQLTLDPSRREMRFGQNEVIPLTPLESRLLEYFMLNAGHVLTADAIIEQIWGSEGGDHDMMRQLIHRLRCKLAQTLIPGRAEKSGSPQAPYIETIPGLGYGLAVDPDQ